MRPEDFQRIASLFEEARQVPAEGREAWIAAQTVDAPDVRTEVLRLLAIHDEGAPAIESAGAAYQETLASLANEAPTQVGPYRIIRELGAGGMGVVYLAEQEEPLRRDVALKIVRLGMNSVEIVRRFDRERQTLARLVHPGIAQVYDAGTTDSGRPYFVLEYVDGEPITTYADRKRLSIPQRIRLFADVCHAIEHAHQKGIVHRDLKPSNVLVAERDDAPTVKVIDFGIAKALDHDEPTMTRLTELGSMVGTPAYMSPEQAAGRFDEVDTRTDIYSLGAVLYELLVGALPFSPESLRKASSLEVQRMLAQDVPSVPSARVSRIGMDSRVEAQQRSSEPEAWVRILKGDLDWITMKSLEKEPARRYGSAGALAADLNRYLHNEPIEARPPSRAYRLRKFAARNRGLITGAALLAASLLVGLIVSTGLYVKAEDARGLAESRLADIERHADRQILTRLRTEADTLWPLRPARAPAMRDWLARAEALAARRDTHQEQLEDLRTHGRVVAPDRSDVDRRALAELRSEEIALMRSRAHVVNDNKIQVAPAPQDRPVTYYLRHTFELSALPTQPMPYRFHAFDAAVLYVNGQEVIRFNLPAKDVAHDTRANGPAPRASRKQRLDPASLRIGTNVIAVEVHVHQPDFERMQLTFDMNDIDGNYVVPINAIWHVAEPGPRPAGDWTAVEYAPTWQSMQGPPGYQPPSVLSNEARLYAGRSRAEIARVRKLKAPLEARLASRQRHQFTRPRVQAAHDELEELVNALANFPKEIAEVRQRLVTATSIRQDSIVAHAPAWDRTIASVRASRHYGGLVLAPQVGLIPLGADPQSKLEEFALLGLGSIPARDAAGKLAISEDSTAVLVLIPAGHSRMGAVRPDTENALGAPNVDPLAEGSEAPIHDVALTAFFLSKYEMTQGQWQRLSGTNPSSWPIGSEAGGHVVTARNPVESITWAQSQKALSQVALTLPTEAQWEYAVRAGTTTPWWCGTDPKQLQGNANLADLAAIRNGVGWADKAWDQLDDGYVVHAPAGTFHANPWGLHETLGNVREWCLDRSGTYESPMRRDDGLRLEFFRPDVVVTRGASYSARPRTARCSKRGRTKSTTAETWAGVRPARLLDR